MSEPTKWITITVPVEMIPASTPGGDASGTFESFDGEGDRDARRGLWVRHDGREMRARNVHLVAGMARAWPVEPTTDWQERVLAEALLIPISSQREERERCAAEIVRYGIPAVAFAIDRAWNEGADAERSAAARAAKVEPTTDYAKKLAEIEARERAATKGPWPSEAGWNNGGTPSRTWRIPARQDGAEVEMLAEDALFVEHAREDVPWLLAQLHAVETALAAAGIPSDGRAPAERVESLAAALRAAKVLAEDGAPGESAADILRAAEMLQRWENGVTVEHDCGGSPTCPMCAAVKVTDNGQDPCVCGGSGITYIGPHRKGQAGCVTPRTITVDLPEPHRGRVVAWHDSARVDGWSVCTTDADGLGDESLVEGLTEAQAKTVAGLVNGSPEPQAASWFDPSIPSLDPEFRALVSEMCSPSPRPPLAMILAVANNGVIGKDGKIPWPISEDLRHFKKTTMGHTLIVGRKTYEGLPPLPGRRLVGVSRKHPLAMMNAGIRVCPTVEDAIGVARETDPEPIVIGGAEVGRAALPYVTRIYLTEIGHDYEGDTTFHLDRAGWRETSRRAGETPGVSFVVLERSEMEERLRRMAQPPPEPDIEPAVGD